VLRISFPFDSAVILGRNSLSCDNFMRNRLQSGVHNKFKCQFIPQNKVKIKQRNEFRWFRAILTGQNQFRTDPGTWNIKVTCPKYLPQRHASTICIFPENDSVRQIASYLLTVSALCKFI
jgi:hypothetical protein